MKHLGKYQIEYSRGVIQEKYLISHKDYIKVIIPILDKIYNLTIKKQLKAASIMKLANKIVKIEFFTDKSPLYEAFQTGILSLPESQGGKTKCKIIKL